MRVSGMSRQHVALIWLVCLGCTPSPKERIEAFLPSFPSVYRAALDREVPLGRVIASMLAKHRVWRHADVLSAVYRPGDTTSPRFVTLDHGLTAAGALLQAQLAAAGDHGLKTERYALEQIRRLIAEAKQRARGNATAEASPPAPGGSERKALEGALARAIEAGSSVGRNWLIERLVSRQSPVPRIAKAWTRAVDQRRRRATPAAHLELTLADGLLRYAEDLGRGNFRPAELRHKRRQLQRARAAGRPSTAASVAARVDATQQREQLRQRLTADLVAVRDMATLQRLLKGLEPRHKQYARLKRALARYRAIVAAGGWSPVRPSSSVRPGVPSPQVEALKRRLEVEGFYRGPIDAIYDQKLVSAVTEYQRTHQLLATGRPSVQLWRSLNVPAERRIQAIEITLERWRHSAIGGDDYYVLVNIPAFELSVFRGGKRVLRRRVVVGRRHTTKCDERTEREVLAHATPVQSSLIDYLVFSPYWNVTRQIKETELDPERGKDPLFFEKHGYELIKAGTPHEWAREMPGPANSLGFVKFIFPNPHDIYVHDTPLKHLFDQPLRAYSHGCMRLQDPWSLAKLLLQADGQWNEAQFKALYRDWQAMEFEPLRNNWNAEQYARMRERAETLRQRVDLRKPVPIHVEYYTVQVDDRQRAHFLLDLYGLDAQRLRPRAARRCVPEKELARRGFANLPERVELLERQALELDSCLPRAAQLLEELERSATAQPGQRTNQTWRTQRLIKRLRKLASFRQEHASLAGRARDDHAALAESVDQRRGRWQETFDARAVRLERLRKALAAMTEQVRAVCVEVETRLASGQLQDT